MSSNPPQDEWSPEAPVPETSPETADRPRRQAGEASQPSVGLQLTVLGWCLWLLLAYILGSRLHSPVATVRWMLLASMVGLMGVWPAVRLSHVRMADRFRFGRVTLVAVFIEWLCLALVLQAAVWPLRVSARWNLLQTLYIDLVLLGWSLLIAAVVALACRWRRGWVRSLAMGGCLVLLFGEPVTVALVNLLPGVTASGWPWWGHPLPALWQLSTAASVFDLEPWSGQAIGISAAASVIWVVLLIVGGMRAGQAKAGKGR